MALPPAIIALLVQGKVSTCTYSSLGLERTMHQCIVTKSTLYRETKHCRDAIVVKLCCQDTPHGLVAVLDADLNWLSIHVHVHIGRWAAAAMGNTE